MEKPLEKQSKKSEEKSNEKLNNLELAKEKFGKRFKVFSSIEKKMVAECLLTNVKESNIPITHESFWIDCANKLSKLSENFVLGIIRTPKNV